MDRADECAKPTCSLPASETYEGPNGNEVRVCRSCYYRLVTGKSTLTVPSRRPSWGAWSGDTDAFTTNTSGNDGCLHDDLEKSLPTNHRDGAHALACPCPECTLARY